MKLSFDASIPISATRAWPRLTFTAITLLAAACGTGAIDRAAAQVYPARPIKIISPFSPSSPPDMLGRLVGQELAERLGQSVTIENRPGGGTTIATKAATAADPDGYTLLQVNSALSYAAVLYPNFDVDPLKSFAPVAALATWTLPLVVNADVPANSVAELIAYAKANPGQANIGFPLGNPPQVLAEMFKTMTEAPFSSVPYRQVSQLMADLLSGRIHACFCGGAGVFSLIQQGKLRALAYTGMTRSALLPQVPTVIESGWPQLALNPSDWTGILAPAGTPVAVVDSLNTAINRSLNSPKVQASISQQGGEAKSTSPSEFAAFLAAEGKKWPPLARQAGLKPN